MKYRPAQLFIPRTDRMEWFEMAKQLGTDEELQFLMRCRRCRQRWVEDDDEILNCPNCDSTSSTPTEAALPGCIVVWDEELL